MSVALMERFGAEAFDVQVREMSKALMHDPSRMTTSEVVSHVRLWLRLLFEAGVEQGTLGGDLTE